MTEIVNCHGCRTDFERPVPVIEAVCGQCHTDLLNRARRDGQKAQPGSLKSSMVSLVQYCLHCQFKANTTDHHIIGRGLFAAMTCSGCEKVKPIYVFAQVSA